MHLVSEAMRMIRRHCFKRALTVVTLLAISSLQVSTADVIEPHILAASVEIRRTAYGIPHIKGATMEAAAFGFGYCQAEDHLLNIMRSILRARGQLSRHFEGEENVESDFWNCQFQVRQRAIATYHKLDPDFRSMLDGFASGLNYYVRLHRDEVPDWVPTVNGHDIAAHGLTGVMRFAFNRGGIIRDFLGRQRGESVSVDESENTDLLGSNMWALAPSRTKSGHAILMGNPHQPWSQVATYYEAHLTVPGELDFYGSTFVGRPVLTTGWNNNLGWSHTVNYPDLEEIYELDLDPNQPDHYLFDGGSVPLTSELARVEVKTDNGLESQSRTFLYSPLGPVIHRSPDKVFVLKSAVYEEFRFYQQWLRLAQAKNFKEFRAALDIQAIPMFNICYADREGNIFYLWNGTVPDMPHEPNRSQAVPANRSSDIWTEFHSIDHLPQLLNPKGGYVHNSNSPPYLTNLNAPLDPANFPASFPSNRLNLRSQHSLQLIHNDKSFSLEDIRDMKYSMRMLLADRVKDDLIAAVKATDPEGELSEAAKLLERWDNTVSAESRGGLLFETWWRRYSLDGHGGYAVPWNPDEPISTPRGLANKDLAARTLRQALEETTTRYGRWDIAWGDVHRIRQGNADLPIGGGSGRLGCFRVVGFRRDSDGKLIVSGGDSWVFAVEFAETPRGYTIIGYSESEVEGSPHFNDQAELYSANTMKRAAFTEKEIQAQLQKRYHPGEE
jgi:acyl-homoserine-lactone acylase